MLKLKSCPRCKGYILIDRDHHGWYEQCLQCGYQHDLRVIEEQRQTDGIKEGTGERLREEQGSVDVRGAG